MDKKFDYLVESERTLSDKFYGSEVKELHLRNLFIHFSNTASLMDKLKKGLYYGRDIELLPKHATWNLALHEDKKDILHAIIGIATEAGELVDAYSEALRNRTEIDIVNLCEEVGDIFWYAAIIAREAGVSFEDIQRNNIEKLAKRFPDKFTEFNANNRDLSAEREILEKITVNCVKGGDVSVRGVSKPINEFLPVELPQSIEPEVGCISKAKLIEAFKAMHNMAPVAGIETPEQVADYIFKNFA